MDKPSGLAGTAAAHQLQPQAQYATQQTLGLLPGALQPVSQLTHAMPSIQQQQQPYQYAQGFEQSQMGSSSQHSGQMGSLNSAQDNAVLQVQAALTDQSKASTSMPAQQVSGILQQVHRPQAETPQGMSQSQGFSQAGGTMSGGSGLLGTVPAASGQQPPAGALIAAAGNKNADGGTPTGMHASIYAVWRSTTCTACFSKRIVFDMF